MSRLAAEPWRHIAAYYADRISSGIHKPGALLPDEALIGRDWAVGVEVVRYAMGELIRLGLVFENNSGGWQVAVRTGGEHT